MTTVPSAPVLYGTPKLFGRVSTRWTAEFTPDGLETANRVQLTLIDLSEQMSAPANVELRERAEAGPGQRCDPFQVVDACVDAMYCRREGAQNVCRVPEPPRVIRGQAWRNQQSILVEANGRDNDADVIAFSGIGLVDAGGTLVPTGQVARGVMEASILGQSPFVLRGVLNLGSGQLDGVRLVLDDNSGLSSDPVDIIFEDRPPRMPGEGCDIDGFRDACTNAHRCTLGVDGAICSPSLDPSSPI